MLCRPYLWGSAALEHYQLKEEVGWLLWKQPGMQEVMELLDRKCLFQSAANFPINVRLEVSEQLTRVISLATGVHCNTDC